MKIEQEFSEPEHVKDRRSYRVRIEGKGGEVIQIVEQMDGGFCIRAPLRSMSIQPIALDAVVVSVKELP